MCVCLAALKFLEQFTNVKLGQNVCFCFCFMSLNTWVIYLH